MPKGTSTPGPLSIAVSDLLYERMAELRSNKSKVADTAGVPRTTLGPILDGKKAIDVEVLDRICQALGVGIEDVLKHAARTTQQRVIDSGIRPIQRA